MRFFKNNWYWILGIVICLIVGSVIIVQRGQQQTAEAGPITPNIAEQTPDTTKSPPPDELANLIWYDSPEEAISYALKGLRNNNSHPDGARLHAVLGFAYQRLGDYKTAWVHLKKGQALTEQCLSCCPSPGEGTPHVEVVEHYDYSAHITAIESGRPLIQRQRTARSSHDKAAAFEELEGFLKWAGAIMRDTPITTNNFLAKELESHLLGQKTTFHPERITRAFELMERHKQSKGMRLLQQSDPPLAQEVLRMFNKKRSKG
ncbi:MAG: hypothetical protein OXM61_24575 [Candidatus Poribacteria bacterium]|nr:hypothetical protein [Candidatus Poribacteria bacterium]